MPDLIGGAAANASGTWLEVSHGRMNPHIDPNLHIWGWEIPAYLFVGGLVAGLMILLPALELLSGKRPGTRPARLLSIGALGLISFGMLALFLDLEHKSNVFRFYTAFRPSSPMSWGSWILLLVYPALALHAMGSLRSDERDALQRWPVIKSFRGLLGRLFAVADTRRGAVLWTTAGVGVALGVYTGLLLGTLAARDVWHSAVLGPLFLASGVSTGAAVMMLVRLDAAWSHRVVRWDTVAIVAELMIIGLWLLGLASGSAGGHNASHAFLGGPWTPWFWSIVVAAGLVVPLILNVVELRTGRAGTMLAPALVLVGGFALRTVLVAAGQAPGL